MMQEISLDEISIRENSLNTTSFIGKNDIGFYIT